MADIVERLANWQPPLGWSMPTIAVDQHSKLMVETIKAITTLRATISRLEGEKSKLREAIRSMNQEATIAIQAEPIPEFSQYSNHDDLPQGLRTHAHIKLAMLRATGRLALAETGEKP